MSTTLAKAASWLTPKRLRAHGLLLALSLWSVYIWNMAAPGLLDRDRNLKGTDFLHFYTLGSLALTRRGADLYKMKAQSELAAQHVPPAAGIEYLPLYPPQVSILFAPFARLSYPWALACWIALSSLIYGLCVYSLWRACPNLRNDSLTVLILALAFPAFWHLIAWGQTSALALACFTVAFFALRAEQEFLAGLALGCLIFKPQLGVAAAVIFVDARRWKVIAGALLAASAQLAAAWIYYGPDSLRTWIQTLVRVPTLLPLLEPKLYQTHCLRTFWTMLVPWPRVAVSLYLITSLLTLVLAARCWKSSLSLSLSLRYSALLLATVLVAPHLTVYDLIILAPAFLLLSSWIAIQPDDPGAPQLKLLLYLAYALPLLGPLARWTHLQLSVPVMLAILYLLFQLSEGSWKSGASAPRKNPGRKRASAPVVAGGLDSILFLLSKQKPHRLRKSLRPRRLVVPGSILNHQPQPLLAQHRPPQDSRQFPHIVHHRPAPLRASSLGRSHSQINSFRPNPHRPALLDRLPVRRPQRRTLHQQPSDHPRPHHHGVKRNQSAQR